MTTIKELKQNSMTPEKAREDKKDIFGTGVGRTLSYPLTIPFLKLGISANAVSALSMVFAWVGFVFIAFTPSVLGKTVGVVMIFIWGLLDSVDGNIARFTQKASATGELWDAMSGYFAGALIFFSMGIGAGHGGFSLLFNNPEALIILGASSSLLFLFPRLVLHKKASIMGYGSKQKGLNDKISYGILKTIAFNFLALTGFMQPLMLLCVLFHAMDIFTIIYFLANCLTALASLRSVFSKDSNHA